MSDATQRIVVLSSCTRVKAASCVPLLVQEDFAGGSRRIQALHRRFEQKLIPAQELYSGQQHMRLMAGVERAREGGLSVELLIASAGYGLVSGEQRLLPYECTFQRKRRAERRSWADRIGLPNAVHRALARPYRLAIVLLGEDYLEACGFHASFGLGGPTLVFCGAAAALKLPQSERLTPIHLGRTETPRFSCGLVGLKGEVAARLLADLAAQRPERGVPAAGLLDRLAATPSPASTDEQMALTA